MIVSPRPEVLQSGVRFFVVIRVDIQVISIIAFDQPLSVRHPGRVAFTLRSEEALAFDREHVAGLPGQPVLGARLLLCVDRASR